MKEIGKVNGVAVHKREPAYDPTEHAYEIVVRRPDGFLCTESIGYGLADQLKQLTRAKRRDYLLSLAAAQLNLKFPPLPEQLPYSTLPIVATD